MSGEILRSQSGKIAVSGEGLAFAKKYDWAMAELIACSQSFAAFLKHWKVRDPASGRVFTLGEELWPGQHRFLHATTKYENIYSLKARKLGYTTLGTAYDGWCLRFRDEQARIHLFSRNENAAVDLIDRLKTGIKRLPDWMQVPIEHETQKMIKINAGGDDIRVAEAYPSSEETAVEQSCSHAHVDEWWRMRNPAKVWQAIEPTIFGSCHIITTGLGPVGYPAEFWKRSLANETRFHALFTPALARPDRDEEWMRQQRGNMTELQFRHEYPMTWQDALAANADYMFLETDLKRASIGCIGPCFALPDRRYIKAWDIGRHKDAAVGIVLDVTDNVRHVVHYERHRNMTYPMLQQRIMAVHEMYPGLTVMEDNGAGQALRETLDLTERECVGFKTTLQSKARMISGLQIAFQNGLLRFNAKAWPQLMEELSIYMADDRHLVQDSVIALAIAHENALFSGRQIVGRIRGVLTW